MATDKKNPDESKRDYVKATPDAIGLLEFGVAEELPAQTKARARTNPFDDKVMESYKTGTAMYAWVQDVESASRAIRAAATHHKIGVQIRPGTKDSDHTVLDNVQYHCVYFLGKEKRSYAAGDETDVEYAEAG